MAGAFHTYVCCWHFVLASLRHGGQFLYVTIQLCKAHHNFLCFLPFCIGDQTFHILSHLFTTSSKHQTVLKFSKLLSFLGFIYRMIIIFLFYLFHLISPNLSMPLHMVVFYCSHGWRVTVFHCVHFPYFFILSPPR